MKRYVVLAALISFVFAAGAQTTLRGTVVNILLRGSRQLALEAWSTDSWQQVQVIPVQPDNSFSATLSAHPGQYRLRVWGQAKVWSEFLLPDSAMAEPELVFALDNNLMAGKPAELPGSLVNVQYARLTAAKNELLQAQDSTSHATAAQIDSARVRLNRLCVEVATKHRNTLLGDVALLLYEPRQADYAKDAVAAKMTAAEFARAHALEKIPFHHDNILYHNAFMKILNRYYDHFSRDEAGTRAFIDGLMSRRNGSEEVDGFLFRYLLDRTMDVKQEGALTYLLNWYTPDCTDENPLPDATQTLLKALSACTPGKTVPDLKFNNAEGQPVSLGPVCAQYNVTILLFWRSNCSHCREFEPELLRIYEKYHPLGVEVYAMASDRDMNDWLGFLRQHPMPWINVFLPAEQRQEIARQFPAPSTPTLIAVDRKRQVISRLISRSSLESFLDGVLQKQKGK